MLFGTKSGPLQAQMPACKYRIVCAFVYFMVASCARTLALSSSGACALDNLFADVTSSYLAADGSMSSVVEADIAGCSPQQLASYDTSMRIGVIAVPSLLPTLTAALPQFNASLTALRPQPPVKYSATLQPVNIPAMAESNYLEQNESSILTGHDGMILRGDALGDLARRGMLAPLDGLLPLDDGDMRFYGALQVYRYNLSTLTTAPNTTERATFAVPLSGSGNLMYYRKDLLDAANIPPPVTWDELLQLAAEWQGQDLNGDSIPDYSLCMHRGGVCARVNLMSMAAPIMQGSIERGLLVSKTCPIVNSSAAGGTTEVHQSFNTYGFMAALTLWNATRMFGPPGESEMCEGVVQHFLNGSCLIAFANGADMFKALAANTSAMQGKFGIAQVPGSTFVFPARSTMPSSCANKTANACPFATNVTLRDGSTAAVNFVPYIPEGVIGAVRLGIPEQLQMQILRYYAMVAGLDGSWNYLLKPNSGISPFRKEHLSLVNLNKWTSAGYAEEPTRAYLAALSTALAAPNVALSYKYVTAVASNAQTGLCAQMIARDGNITAAFFLLYLQSVQIAARAQKSVYGGNYSLLLMDYLSELECPAPELPPVTGGGSLNIPKAAYIPVACVLGVAAIIGVIMLLEVRNKRQHKDLLGRVKPPVIGAETTLMVIKLQEFDELWQLMSAEASERSMRLYNALVAGLLRQHSGYMISSEEDIINAAFHTPRDATEFALELQNKLLKVLWPRELLQSAPFASAYYSPTHSSSFVRRQTSLMLSAPQVQIQTGAGAPPADSSAPTATTATSAAQVNSEDQNLLCLGRSAALAGVRSFGDQCAASWAVADGSGVDTELVFRGLQVRIALCAVCCSTLEYEVDSTTKRTRYKGEAQDIAASIAEAAQGGMVVIPQQTFRQLPLEYLSEQCLFCHYGEYQMKPELVAMDLYLAVDRTLLSRLAGFQPLRCHMQLSQGAMAAPVHHAAMVFTYMVGVQTLLSWNYEVAQAAIASFTKLAQSELKARNGYLVEHVDGFMLSAFYAPNDAIVWGLRVQELMLRQDWPAELLQHELCEEVTVTLPRNGRDVSSNASTTTVFRGPRLKTGIDIGEVLARLHTMTGRMTYRGRVMNRAARIASTASTGQVLCSSEAWEQCSRAHIDSHHVAAFSLGLFQLKGIAERIGIMHCTYHHHVPTTQRRSLVVKHVSNVRRTSSLGMGGGLTTDGTRSSSQLTHVNTGFSGTFGSLEATALNGLASAAPGQCPRFASQSTGQVTFGNGVAGPGFSPLSSVGQLPRHAPSGGHATTTRSSLASGGGHSLAHSPLHSSGQASLSEIGGGIADVVARERDTSNNRLGSVGPSATGSTRLWGVLQAAGGVLGVGGGGSGSSGGSRRHCRPRRNRSSSLVTAGTHANMGGSGMRSTPIIPTMLAALQYDDEDELGEWAGASPTHRHMSIASQGANPRTSVGSGRSSAICVSGSGFSSCPSNGLLPTVSGSSRRTSGVMIGAGFGTGPIPSPTAGSTRSNGHLPQYDASVLNALTAATYSATADGECITMEPSSPHMSNPQWGGPLALTATSSHSSTHPSTPLTAASALAAATATALATARGSSNGGIASALLPPRAPPRAATTLDTSSQASSAQRAANALPSEGLHRRLNALSAGGVKEEAALGTHSPEHSASALPILHITVPDNEFVAGGVMEVPMARVPSAHKAAIDLTPLPSTDASVLMSSMLAQAQAADSPRSSAAIAGGRGGFEDICKAKPLQQPPPSQPSSAVRPSKSPDSALEPCEAHVTAQEVAIKPPVMTAARTVTSSVASIVAPLVIPSRRQPWSIAPDPSQDHIIDEDSPSSSKAAGQAKSSFSAPDGMPSDGMHAPDLSTSRSKAAEGCAADA